jgi:hypothetical protein
MALPRTAVLLLLLPAPAVVYLAASMEDVSASAQCLPSAEAVRQQYPGSWASWTTHAQNHKGEKCWFPAMRENHSRHIEAVLRRAAQTLMRKESKPAQQVESATTDRTRPEEAPVAFVAEMNGLGWSFRTRSTKVGAAGAVEEAVTPGGRSSFDDRFGAVRDVNSVQKPSVIQRMMDPVGAIPNIP